MSFAPACKEEFHVYITVTRTNPLKIYTYATLCIIQQSILVSLCQWELNSDYVISIDAILRYHARILTRWEASSRFRRGEIIKKKKKKRIHFVILYNFISVIAIRNSLGLSSWTAGGEVGVRWRWCSGRDPGTTRGGEDGEYDRRT